MQVSARYLGQEYGLTAEETNRLLFKQGILTGKPGAYDVTPKGRPYVVTEYYHRGTGGYDHYNSYWSTRTYDENIKEILDFSAENIAEVKKEVADARAARYAKRAAERAEADAEFIAKNTVEKAKKVMEENDVKETLKGYDEYKKMGVIFLIISGVAITGYGIYKVTPKIKKWWIARKEQAKDHIDSETIEQDKNI